MKSYKEYISKPMNEADDKALEEIEKHLDQIYKLLPRVRSNRKYDAFKKCLTDMTNIVNQMYGA